MLTLFVRSAVRLAPPRQGVAGALMALLSAFFTSFPAPAAQAPAAPESVSTYACGGKLEVDVWRRWDERGLQFAQGQLIEKRLMAVGDTYALYDIEILFHNLLAMAQRCHRTGRQMDMLRLVTAAYAQLVPAPGQAGRAWVCRGGAVCNSTNRLVNTEVMLNSVQFLAFASSLAQSLNQGSPSTAARDFVDLTAQISLEHLRRWSVAPARSGLRKRVAATPGDIKNGSSALFLTDKELWQTALYADLAGLLAGRPAIAKQTGVGSGAFAPLREHLLLLLQLFASRTTVQTALDPKAGKSVQLADLDAGFWRLFPDNRYAGYSGGNKPLVCAAKGETPETRINPATIAPVTNLGWDLSHARRLVHFFDAIERNRAAMTQLFHLAATDLPSRDTMAAFARQLRMRVWNQDKSKPLFANYYSGANGWYRVAYDNGAGRCMEGYPPFGLTDAFPTGGYATWDALDPGLHGLGVRLYELTKSGVAAEQEFIKTYYPNLGQSAGGNGRLLAELMFWPTLVK